MAIYLRLSKTTCLSHHPSDRAVDWHMCVWFAYSSLSVNHAWVLDAAFGACIREITFVRLHSDYIREITFVSLHSFSGCIHRHAILAKVIGPIDIQGRLISNCCKLCNVLRWQSFPSRSTPRSLGCNCTWLFSNRRHAVTDCSYCQTCFFLCNQVSNSCICLVSCLWIHEPSLATKQSTCCIVRQYSTRFGNLVTVV